MYMYIRIISSKHFCTASKSRSYILKILNVGMYTLNWSLELGQYTNVYNIEFEQRIYLTIYLFIYWQLIILNIYDIHTQVLCIERRTWCRHEAIN